jgi:predicted anti-sigma-YlaC factor YlaD
MNCEGVRVAVSALLDGEPAHADAGEVTRHLDGCAGCREWRDAAHALTRRARLTVATTPAHPGRQALERIRAASPSFDTARPTGALRIMLIAVAIAQLAVTIPMLLFGHSDLARDMGASGMALVVGFAVVAWRPSRATAISPVVGTAAGLCVLMAALGMFGGTTDLGDEAPHAIALVGWLLVCRIAWLTPPIMGSPERTLMQSLRLAACRFVSPASADFLDRSSPTGHAGMLRAGTESVDASVAASGGETGKQRAVA